MLGKNNKISIAVIGVGHLGRHHARILSELKNSITLEGVVDIHLEQAKKIAQSCKVPYYRDIGEIVDKVQAVVIAVPTPFHFEVGKFFLDRGVHCLIEKPLSQEIEEAEELIEIAQSKSCILQVGHVERFNPAVIASSEYIQSPKFIEVNRLGSFNPRMSHIGVILDLMIHDLDIILSLVHSPVESLEAFGAKILTEHEDIVKVRLRFKNGCIADLSASRVSMEQRRTISLFQPNACISIDYAQKKIKIYRTQTRKIKNFSDIEIITPSFEDKEPLRSELQHFIECIQEGKTPLVSGEHGRNALELGFEILKQINLHQ